MPVSGGGGGVFGPPTLTLTAGRGALVDGSVVNASSKEASMLFHSVTMIVPDADGLTATNGARVEWLDCFTYFADTGIHLTQGSEGFVQNSGTAPGSLVVGPQPFGQSYTSNSVTIPKAYYSAPLAASLVGQLAIAYYYPSAPVFYTVTSVTTETNDSSQWRLTFAETFNNPGNIGWGVSFYPDNGTTFIIPNDIWDTTGNSVGEKWVAWYKTNLPLNFETTVGKDWTINLAGLIWIVDYVIEDPVNSNMWRIYVTTSLSAGVGIPILSSPGVGTVTRYGAELRSIGSANVYGNYGAIADGANTLAYLISHNFGYIGTGTVSTNDPSLAIQANEVLEANNGHIYYESVDHKGDFRIGNIFYVNQQTGAISFNAQSISFNPLGSISVEGGTSPSYIDRTVVQTGNIRIHDNNIDSVAGPVNFSADSGSTYLNTNVFVTGNTTVSADINVDGNLFLGNQATDTITVLPKLTQNLLPDDVGGPFTLGTDSKRWNTLYATVLNVDNVIQLASNTVSTLTTNTNLVLSAAGTGKVQVTNTDVTIANNLTVGNTLTVNGTSSLRDTSINGTVTQTGDWNQIGSSNAYITGTFGNNNIAITGSSYFSVPNIKLQNSEISVTSTNTDLTLTGATTGGVVLDQRLKLKDSTISNVWSSPTTDTQKSVIFQPNGTGNVTISSTNAVKIPVGNTTTRTIAAGEIRYNNLTNLYEGGAGVGLISFNGLYDSDRNTYITTGPTDNTIYFGINNVVKTTITSTSLNSDIFKAGNVQLTENTLSNTVDGNDLTFSPNNDGNTLLNGLPIRQNYIINSLDSSLNLNTTGTGYIKFSGTKGLVVPTGDDSGRRATPEIGELRYNTQALGVLEVFDGTQWMSAVGNNASVSAEEVLDILDLWTLILG